MGPMFRRYIVWDRDSLSLINAFVRMIVPCYLFTLLSLLLEISTPRRMPRKKSKEEARGPGLLSVDKFQ